MSLERRRVRWRVYALDDDRLAALALAVVLVGALDELAPVPAVLVDDVAGGVVERAGERVERAEPDARGLPRDREPAQLDVFRRRSGGSPARSTRGLRRGRSRRSRRPRGACRPRVRSRYLTLPISRSWSTSTGISAGWTQRYSIDGTDENSRRTSKLRPGIGWPDDGRVARRAPSESARKPTTTTVTRPPRSCATASWRALWAWRAGRQPRA